MFNILPFPFPPECTIMMFFQIIFGLNVWAVIIIGVAGSFLGRFILLLNAPTIARKFLKNRKMTIFSFLAVK